MARYHIIWEIDDEADSPEAAARQAWKAIRRPDSTLNIFDVIDEEGTHTRVDLQDGAAGEASGESV